MKLKEKRGVVLTFFIQTFKKKRRKPQEKQRNKNFWVKP